MLSKHHFENILLVFVNEGLKKHNEIDFKTSIYKLEKSRLEKFDEIYCYCYSYYYKIYIETQKIFIRLPFSNIKDMIYKKIKEN